MKTVDEIKANHARLSAACKSDNWFPACGGAEVPFKARSGTMLLYCWQPGTGRHAYLDCDSDIILSDADSFMHLYGSR